MASYRRAFGTHISVLVALLVVLAFGTPVLAESDAGYLTTGTNGAQTGISVSHTTRFTIVAKASATIYGGDFVMKAGSATTARISFRLYDSIDKSHLLADFTYVNGAAFCRGHGGNCQSFSSTRFKFFRSVAIAAGNSYYAEITSPAADPQNTAYFIKGGDICSIVTETGAIVPGTDCSSGFIPPPPKPSLAVTKTGPATAIAPGKISYSLAVANSGDGKAGGATIKDQLPAGLAYAGYSGIGWTCSASGVPALITCRYQHGIAPDGRSTTLHINTIVDDNVSSVDNWASVDPTGGNNPIAPSKNNCSAADVGTGECDNVVTELRILPPFLDIALSDPTPVPNSGGNTTYTVTVTNNGDGVTLQPVHAYNVIPAGTEFVSAGNASWVCSHTGANPDIVDCLFQGATIRPDYSFNFPVVVKVTSPTPGGEEFVDTAYVARVGGQVASPPAMCMSDDTIACAQNVFVLPYEWSIAKSAPQPSLQVGQRSTYTITVTTNGNNVPADIKDQLPEGMILYEAKGTGWLCQSNTGNLVLCAKTISSGVSEQIAVTVDVPLSLANQTVTNYASVGPRDNTLTPGPNCDDPTTCASNTETVLTTTGFSLAKSDPEPPLEPGKTSTYTLTLETDTPGVDADVKDLLPDGLTLVSASGTGWNCSAAPTNPVLCQKTGILASEEIAVTVAVEANVTATTVTNFASAGLTGSAPEPGPACPAITGAACAANKSPVNPAASHTIAKSAPVPPLQVGKQSVYTLTVTTDGQGVATEVKDTLPAGMTLVKAEGDGWFCDPGAPNSLSCLKTISSGASEQIFVTVDVADDTASQTLTNYASAGPEGRAPDPGSSCTDPNACASNTSTVLGPAGFTISKSAPVPPLRVGQQSVYTLTVGTDGEDVVADIKDQLPDGMSLVSAEGEGWMCDEVGNNLVHCQKSISSAVTEKIYVTVDVAADVVGQNLTNYASAGGEGEAPVPGPGCSPNPSCAESGGEVNGPAGYQVTKSQPQPALQVNRQSTYIITVSSDTPGVEAEVKDQLPDGMMLVSAMGDGWNCSVDASNLVLCQKTLQSTDPEQIAVTVNVEPALNNQTVTNYASTGGTGNAPQPGASCTDPGLCASSEAQVADIREEIKEAVQEDVRAFLAARLDNIIGSFDQQSRLQRFRNTACGVSHDMSLSGEATSNHANLAANGFLQHEGRDRADGGHAGPAMRTLQSLVGVQCELRRRSR